MAAGDYELIAGMYKLETLERLPAESGLTRDFVSLGKISYKPGD